MLYNPYHLATKVITIALVIAIFTGFIQYVPGVRGEDVTATPTLTVPQEPPTPTVEPVATLEPTPTEDVTTYTPSPEPTAIPAISAPVDLLREDAEIEGGMWTTTGAWNRITVSPAPSGSWIWQGNTQTTSPTTLGLIVPLPLPTLAQIDLTYWQQLDLGQGDIAQVQVSTDNQNWISLVQETAAQNGGWSQSTVNLSAYAGRHLWLQFVLTADADPLTVGQGWSLDDIVVQAIPLNIPPSTLESGASTTPLPPTITSEPQEWMSFEATHTLLHYSAEDWQTYPVSAAVYGIIVGTTTPGATLTTSFWGTGIRVRYAQSPDGGTFIAQVDSDLPQAGDSQAETYRYGNTLIIEGLTNTQHTLTLTNQSGAMGLEAVDVQNGILMQLPAVTATPSATVTPDLTTSITPSTTATSVATLSEPWRTYEDTDPMFVYGPGVWQTFEVAGAAGGTLTGTADPNAGLTVYFNGTGIQVLYSRGPEGRTLTAQVDGGTLQTADGQASTYSYGSSLTFEGLPAGDHTLSITNGTGAIWIEAIQVQGTVLTPPHHNRCSRRILDNAG